MPPENITHTSKLVLLLLFIILCFEVLLSFGSLLALFSELTFSKCVLGETVIIVESLYNYLLVMIPHSKNTIFTKNYKKKD